MFLAVLTIAISGCAGVDDISETPPEKAVYQRISPEQAKEMLDANADIVLLDVRTEEEFDELHIPGAMLLPDFQIAELAPDLLPDKNAVILIYCRSGRRSENAANELIDMGYMNVYDFGGIIDWTFD